MSRAAAVGAVLVGTWPGRILLLGAAIKLLALAVRLITGSVSVPPVLDAVNTIGSLCLVAGVGYVLYRLVLRAKRRLLWRVRRKLILSYIFIGFVPALLIVAFFVVAGLMLFLN
ncbi:MAG: hypothetical protein IMZ71_02345, partial [Chloroflexi bacterium]|nr:hypothetical protein [Chloroflexota bacterium]